MQDVLRHPKWRDVIAQKADVLAHGHFDCMPVRRIGIYTVDRSAPSAAGGLYFGRDRCDLWSGFNFQITADQSGRDDFREDHQRKFGNIGG